MPIPPEFHQAVQRGMALLDERRPGWWQRVNLVRFAMSSCTSCVLGQLCGDYDDGLVELWPDLASRSDWRGLWHASKHHGFTIPEGYGHWCVLAEAWREAIRNRAVVALFPEGGA